MVSIGTVSLTELVSQLPVFARAAYRRTRTRAPYTFSFNVSDRCPIGCDCYWRAQDRVDELSDDDVVAFFWRMRKAGYVLANLVGGEPYVRPDLLEKIAGIIPFSWLVTSGTTPLRRLPRTTHVVSIDGADAETHNAVRKSAGLYERIHKHVARARADGDFPLFIHTTLNALNYHQIGAICHVWRDNGLADGLLVSMHTPIAGAKDDGVRLPPAQRVWVVEELLRLKKQHGAFFPQTEGMMRLLHPDHTATLTPATCNTAQLVPSFDATGNRIAQCILSEKADCTQCGCVVTTIMSDDIQPTRIGSFLDTMSLSTRLCGLR